MQLPGIEGYRPDQLSGGQRQRVALARALVVRPKVLLLDEPLSNLETGLREELRDMIRILQKEVGITTIFVTHDQAEAVAMADRIALLQDGRLLQVGPPRSFYEQPADEKVARFFGSSNLFSGVKRGSTVITSLGILEISQIDWPDGEVLVTIRPEAIQIGANEYNNFFARVSAYQYRGQIAYCETQVNGVALKVFTPPFHSYKPGKSVLLHIPREHIRLLPPGSSNQA